MNDRGDGPTIQRSWFALTLLLALVACGGGGGNSSTPPSTTTAEGLWIGQTSSNRFIKGLVFETGEFWVFYTSVGGFVAADGFIHGTGSSSGGNFSAGDSKDFNFAGLGIQDAAVSATYTQRQTFNGSVTYTTGGVTFTSAFSAAYDQPPSLAGIAGSYGARLTISASGAFSGSLSSGCQFSGSVAPRARGNAYNLALTLGGPPCNNPGATASGISYYDSPSKVLYNAAVTSNGGAFLLSVVHP